MLKLNKIYDWTVVPYTYDQIVNHTTMPSKLKLDIAKIWEENCAPRGYVPGGPPCPWLNMAWLHCDGENYADMENIGPVCRVEGALLCSKACNSSLEEY